MATREHPALTADDLARATTRSLQIQALLTPERMQGPGFAFSLLPALRRLYSAREDLAPAMARQMSYFATHPVLSGYVLGAAARLEERRAAGDPVDAGRIDALKRALASPLAALGDPLFWVTLRPLAGLLGILAVALPPHSPAEGPDVRVLVCPLITLLAYNAVALPHRVRGVARGYALADSPASLLRSLRLADWEGALARAGSVAYGALLALAWVSLDLGSAQWGASGGARVASLAPLLLGAAVGFAGLRRWPAGGVGVAIGALAAAIAVAAGS
jgi:PTS system mannose-specific IID component